MTATLTFFILALMFLYGRLDFFYSHAEEACDEKFLQSVASCKDEDLSPKEKKIIETLQKHFTSNGVGFLLMLGLLFLLPRRLMCLFEITKKEPALSKNVSRAMYFWSMSHIYRSTPVAIMSHVVLSLHRVMLMFKTKDVPELIDGHAESSVFLKANDYIQKHHCLDKLAA